MDKRFNGNAEILTVIRSKERAGTKDFITLTEFETGEVIDAFWQERRRKPSGRPPDKVKTPDFYKVYATNWKHLIKKKSLSLNEIGFFFSLLVFVDYESNFLVHPKTKKECKRT